MFIAYRKFIGLRKALASLLPHQPMLAAPDTHQDLGIANIPGCPFRINNAKHKFST